MAYVSWSVVFGEQPSAAKWNILGTNDASFNDGTGIADDAIIARHLADGIVTPDRLVTGAPTTWDWQTFTPSWTNLTVGNGTNTGKYRVSGKTVQMVTVFTFGSTSSITIGAYFTPPAAITPSSNYSTAIHPVGVAELRDISGAFWLGAPAIRNAVDRINILAIGVSGFVQYADIGSTTPFTWTTGDILATSITYGID